MYPRSPRKHASRQYLAVLSVAQINFTRLTEMREEEKKNKAFFLFSKRCALRGVFYLRALKTFRLRYLFFCLSLCEPELTRLCV